MLDYLRIPQTRHDRRRVSKSHDQNLCAHDAGPYGQIWDGQMDASRSLTRIQTTSSCPCVKIKTTNDIKLTLSFVKIHNQRSTRALMNEIVDPQMVNIADFDCFSQVVFKSIEDYKSFKKDPYYKKHLFGDHVHFADTQRSQ